MQPDYRLLVAAFAPVIPGVVFGLVIAVIVAIPVIGWCMMCLVVPCSILVTPYLQIVLGHLYGQISPT